MVSRLENIISPPNTMVGTTKTMISGIETRMCVMQTIFTMTETSVTAAQKMVAVAPTVVCVINHSFAHLHMWVRTSARTRSNQDSFSGRRRDAVQCGKGPG